MDLIPLSKIKDCATGMGLDNSAAILHFGKVTAISDDEIEIRNVNGVAKIKIGESDMKPEVGDFAEVQLGNDAVPDKILRLYRGKGDLPTDGGFCSTSMPVTEVVNEERGRRLEMRDYAPVTAPVTAPVVMRDYAPVTMRDYAPVSAPVVVNIGPDPPLDLPIQSPCSPASLEHELRKSEINFNEFLDDFSDTDIMGLFSD